MSNTLDRTILLILLSIAGTNMLNASKALSSADKVSIAENDLVTLSRAEQFVRETHATITKILAELPDEKYSPLINHLRLFQQVLFSATAQQVVHDRIQLDGVTLRRQKNGMILHGLRSSDSSVTLSDVPRNTCTVVAPKKPRLIYNFSLEIPLPEWPAPKKTKEIGTQTDVDKSVSNNSVCVAPIQRLDLKSDECIVLVTLLSGEIYRLSVNGKHETVATLRSMISDLLNSNEEPSKLELSKNNIPLIGSITLKPIALLANEQRIISIQASQKPRLELVYQEYLALLGSVANMMQHRLGYILEPQSLEANDRLLMEIQKILAIDIMPCCNTSKLVSNFRPYANRLKTQVGEYEFSIFNVKASNPKDIWPRDSFGQERPDGYGFRLVWIDKERNQLILNLWSSPTLEFRSKTGVPKKILLQHPILSRPLPNLDWLSKLHSRARRLAKWAR